jgi:uncharacterized integral membrane protein
MFPKLREWKVWMARREDEKPEQALLKEVHPAEEARPRELRKQSVFVGTGLFWSLIVGLLLGAALVILIFQNTQSVGVEFLWLEFTAPLIGLLLGTALATVILAEIVGVVVRRRRRRVLTEQEDLRRLTALPKDEQPT